MTLLLFFSGIVSARIINDGQSIALRTYPPSIGQCEVCSAVVISAVIGFNWRTIFVNHTPGLCARKQLKIIAYICYNMLTFNFDYFIYDVCLLLIHVQMCCVVSKLLFCFVFVIGPPSFLLRMVQPIKPAQEEDTGQGTAYHKMMAYSLTRS